ncbi:type IV secretion protein Rhs, partial [Buttiauxella noackiae]
MSEEDKDTLKEEGARLLTPGEIELAKSVFKSTIEYNTVWIHKESYLPFNLQDEH